MYIFGNENDQILDRANKECYNIEMCNWDNIAVRLMPHLLGRIQFYCNYEKNILKTKV